jgi:ceramide glucosyltransferase
MIGSVLGWVLLALALAGCGYTLAAAAAMRRFFANRSAPARSELGVTILKPLYGAEPRLVDNLATFLAQDHTGPVQLLCGVADARDPAVLAVEVLRMRYPTARIDLVVDARRHGSNGKISNLVNMTPQIAHELVVLSDSDMAAPRDYLSTLVTAAARPGVGVVTCLYRGRGDAGWASRLAAAGLSYRFLLDATFASSTGQIGDACMGSTIALRREMLEQIGGFARFADVLADDHAIGQAVRATGRTIAIPPLLLTHACDEPTLAAVWRHDLRWAATVRQVTPPLGYAGAVITHPLPLALAGAAFHPVAGLTVALIAIAVRAFAAVTADRISGEETAPLWWLPARDLMSFAVYLASYAARHVEWRGERLRMATDGRIAAEPAE